MTNMQTLTSNFQLPALNHQLPITLDDGLVLRAARAEDTDALAEHNAGWLGNDPYDAMLIAAWTRDFVSEKHPTCGPENVFIVEETQAKKIVSSMCLIPQSWTYAGISFGVGRPEAVATHPDYRSRGLVRKMFEVLHAQSAAMGHLLQGITGISWFYRQFGYEYALDLSGGKFVFFDQIESLPPNDAYRLCAMTLDDIPFVARLYERDCARSLVACVRDEKIWRHMLVGYGRDNADATSAFRVALHRTICEAVDDA